MIREAVPAMGMIVDILTWDGNIEELRAFTPDEILGEENGVMMTASVRGIATGSKRNLRYGDLLVRPAGRPDVSPLHFYCDPDHEWPRLLGLTDGENNG